MKTSILFGLILFILQIQCFADEPAPMDTMDKINYSVGHQIGGDFKKQHVEMREEALIQGIRDALQSNPPRMKKGEMRQMLLDLKKMVIEANNADRERYWGEGREFLQANAQKQGVVTLESGLQYKVIKEGNGRQADISDFVLVEYRGTRLDGREFDSSYRDGKPLKIQVAKVIPGWTEALQLMKEGAEWQLFIPADLAFGERGPLADQTVLYDIKLIKVSPE